MIAWGLLALVLVLALTGCAFAFGSGPATVVNRIETKREVDAATPVLEDVLLEEVRAKNKLIPSATGEKP